MANLIESVYLDTYMLQKVFGYYIYRSAKEGRGTPIIDGVYVRRETLGENPPESMKLVLEWK